jgi:3-hydroxypropionate dehydrogenase (NADP+)
MKPIDIKTVAVIGGGTIGAGWVTLFATKGYNVNLYSRKAETRERSMHLFKSNVDFMVNKSVIRKKTAEDSLTRVSLFEEMKPAVAKADFVVESVADDIDLKKDIFEKLDIISREEVILASSSSGLLMTEIQKVTKRPERCIIAHPWNPPHLIPLIEIVPGKKTAPETTELTYNFMLSLGKVPVLVKKEVNGYIGNRLAAALWREAIDLVQKGVATVEDVDKALYAGPGIRWAFMGQHLIYHLGGGKEGIGHFIDHLGRTTFKSIWEDMATWSYISDSTKMMLIEGVREETRGRQMDELIQWRNDKLIELLKVIYS